MRKIYLVKKNPELPVNGNNWIVMNGFEFMKFIQTPEGRERRKCFNYQKNAILKRLKNMLQI